MKLNFKRLWPLCFGLFCVNYLAQSEEYISYKDILSSKYIDGSYLVYDCKDQHWVCTEEVSKLKCEHKRKMGLRNRSKVLSCYYLSHFETKELCHQKQLSLVNQAHFLRECLHPEFQKNFIGL